MRLDALQSIAPVHIADLVAHQAPVGEALEVVAEALRLLSRQEINEGVAKARLPMVVHRQIHQGVAAAETMLIQEVKQHRSGVVVRDVAHHHRRPALRGRPRAGGWGHNPAVDVVKGLQARAVRTREAVHRGPGVVEAARGGRVRAEAEGTRVGGHPPSPQPAGARLRPNLLQSPALERAGPRPPPRPAAFSRATLGGLADGPIAVGDCVAGGSGCGSNRRGAGVRRQPRLRLDHYQVLRLGEKLPPVLEANGPPPVGLVPILNRRACSIQINSLLQTMEADDVAGLQPVQGRRRCGRAARPQIHRLPPAI
mmetsp:Transcript_34604/g.98473  ORF Transcript_34604/g.98473 Transcript_34604/m.98473 type:complete len:311 (-) Transcript_34604:262-1194(-)